MSRMAGAAGVLPEEATLQPVPTEWWRSCPPSLLPESPRVSDRASPASPVHIRAVEGWPESPGVSRVDIKQGEDVRLVVQVVENPQTPQLSLGLHDLGGKVRH